MSTDYTAAGLKLNDLIDQAPALGLTVERRPDGLWYLSDGVNRMEIYSDARDEHTYFTRHFPNRAADMLDTISDHFGVRIVSEYEEQTEAANGSRPPRPVAGVELFTIINQGRLDQ